MARMHEVVGYVKRSRNRLDVLRALGRSILSTNNIAAKTILPVTTVRPIVLDLRRRGLIRKAARKNRRPMIYGTTKLGEAVLKMRNTSGDMKWKGTGKQKRISRTVLAELHKK